MATEPRTTGLTYDDLVRMLPEQDMVRRDLIDGELFVSPSPSLRHQEAVSVLHGTLYAYVETHGGKVLTGPFDVRLTDTNVLEPDVLYVRPENVARIEQRYVPFAPDLVIEVSSPSTRSRDLARKKELYEQFGATEYWFVDLDADRVEVRRLEEGRYGRPVLVPRGEELTSPVLPGFALAVDMVLGSSS